MWQFAGEGVRIGVVDGIADGSFRLVDGNISNVVTGVVVHVHNGEEVARVWSANLVFLEMDVTSAGSIGRIYR